MTTITHGYECGGCFTFHEEYDDAATCCPPRAVWACACGCTYSDKANAEDCCGGENCGEKCK